MPANLGDRVDPGVVVSVLVGIGGKPAQLGQGVPVVVAVGIDNGSHHPAIGRTIEHDEVWAHQRLLVALDVDRSQ